MLFAVVIGAFAGTAYAALSYMDTGPSAEALRAERAKRDAVLARKDRNARRAAAARRIAAGGRRSTPPARRWAAKADVVCDQTYDDAWDLLDRTAIRTRPDILRFLDESVRLGDRLVISLERLGPAPNRSRYGRFLSTLKASQAADRHALRSLRGGGDPAAFRSRMQASAKTNVELRRLALGLGSVACSELFDPGSF